MELDGTGVTVTCLIPGPTDTDFFERGDLLDARLGATDHEDDLVEVARDSELGDRARLRRLRGD